MISDFVGEDNGRRKPKRIEPVEKEPGKSIHELVAEHDANEDTALQEESQTGADTTEPTFIPPDEIAATAADENTEELEDSSTPQATTSSAQNDTHTAKASGFLAWRWPLSRKWTIVSAAIVALLIGGGAAFAYLQQPKGQGASVKVKKATYVPKDTRVASTLSGLLVDPSVNQRPVTGVMIENSTDARPQSGIDQAGVVFEAIAEGGITRFLAIFQDTQPDYIGPVRSARPYYVQWCMGFDCALAHAGGSPEALQNIRSWGTKDLNDTAGIFWRVSSRYAPHNLYSSITKLNELESSRGYGAPTFTGFARKKDQPYKAPSTATNTKSAPKTTPDSRTAASSIDIAISSSKFNSHYDYDAKTNAYHRSQAGAPHTTVNASGGQAQISPKVVVAMVMQYGIEADDLHSQYTGRRIFSKTEPLPKVHGTKPTLPHHFFSKMLRAKISRSTPVRRGLPLSALLIL
jgi:hypothetical protein